MNIDKLKEQVESKAADYSEKDWFGPSRGVAKRAFEKGYLKALEDMQQAECLNCGVPNHQHGTCCGWHNATTTVALQEIKKHLPMIVYNHLGEEENYTHTPTKGWFLDQEAVRYADSRTDREANELFWMGCREGYTQGYMDAEKKDETPITPELMMQMGFCNSLDYYWRNDVFFLSFIPPESEGGRWAVKCEQHIITSIQYLHELQALIKVLTGEELKAK